MSELLTVPEAAERARCDVRVIRRAIREGEMRALYSSRWVVDPDDLKRWMERRGGSQLQRSPEVARRASRRPSRRDDRPGSVVRLSEIRGGEGA